MVRRLRERMDYYHNHPTTPITSTTTVHTTVPPTTTPIGGWVFYPPGTHDHRAKKRYSDIGAEFIGFEDGWAYEFVTKHRCLSLEECLNWCVEKRKKDGRDWNGVVFQ